MDESKEKINTDYGRKLVNPFAVKKPKKRSIVERELETNMTAWVTSPVIVGDGVNTSRYGRARRMKTKNDSPNVSIETLTSPKSENTPAKVQSFNTKQLLSPPYKTETPKKNLETSLDKKDSIYQEKQSLSCFNSPEVLPKSQSSSKNFPKVYIRKDLIQKRDTDDDIILIKDLFSTKSVKKQIKLIERSSEKLKSTHSSFNKQNGLIDNSSVVKALDFDGNKRDSDRNKPKKEDKAEMSGSKSKLFQVEVSCPYQVGDLAWARMGTFPFWPCIITRDPATEMFVRKKCKYNKILFKKK